jgi:transcriptional antiterminator RfaH
MKQWYVIYTKPRNEKKVALELLKKGIEAYCPVKIEIRQWTDRKKKIEKPLFSSYCFVYIEETQRYDVLEVYGVSRFVYWLGKPAVVKDKEIEEIKRWLNDFSHEKIYTDTFQVNDKVVITSGTLINQEAIVLSQRGNQLVLHLESIGYRMCISMADVTVEKQN